MRVFSIDTFRLPDFTILFWSEVQKKFLANCLAVFFIQTKQKKKQNVFFLQKKRGGTQRSGAHPLAPPPLDKKKTQKKKTVSLDSRRRNVRKTVEHLSHKNLTPKLKYPFRVKIHS